MPKPENTARRRRRALAAREGAAAPARPAAARPRRRRITAQARETYPHADREAWQFAPRPGYMGLVFDQPFYSCRYEPGAALELPFAKSHPFACLIHSARPVGEEEFRAVAQTLLTHRMRFALCTGVQGEQLQEILNDLLEPGEYHEEGRSAVAAANEDDPIEEVMEYFALPSGIAPWNLILTIGDARVFQATLRTFGTVVHRMRTGLCA